MDKNCDALGALLNSGVYRAVVGEGGGGGLRLELLGTEGGWK